MTHPNLDLIDQFFAAYTAHDMDALRKVVSADITWTFPGRNPFNGTHRGIEAVVAFFDSMGGIMGQSAPQVEKLIIAANDAYVIEGQHITTHRYDKHNLDHHWAVMWRIENGKIVAGQHLASDQYAVDDFFNGVMNVNGDE
jgi:ketosteroid isomerase-like protein